MIIFGAGRNHKTSYLIFGGRILVPGKGANVIIQITGWVVIKILRIIAIELTV